MPSPLLIVALDGADPEALLTWAREGHLPVLASLMQQGSYAHLRGPEMISVHAVWTSFWSGISIARHEFFHQRSLRPGTYQLHWHDAPDGNAPAFWAARPPATGAVVTIDVLGVSPVDGLRGAQVTGWGDHSTPPAASSLPAGLLGEIERTIGPRIPTDETGGSPATDRQILKQLLDRVERKGRLARHLIAHERAGLAVVTFGDTHAAGHRYRRYRDDRTAPADLMSAPRTVCQAIDREIGALRDGFAQTPNTFVVSNSGIEDGYPMGGVLEAFLRELGYVTYRLSPVSAIERAAAFVRRTVPHRWSGAPASRFGRGVDWSRTTAFAIPAQYTGYLRVNLRGREPQGTVSPGAEYDAVLDRLEHDLRELVDDETRQPVVRGITRTVREFGGPPPARLPDLFVEWHPSLRARRIRHPRALLRQDKLGDPRGNHHSDVGVVIAAGPDIRAGGDAGDLAPTDFAPLFVSLLGGAAPTSAPLSPASGAFLRH
jgi:predicted AlkP superfamily phosphohydrolase/phosphomutase